MDIDTFFQHCAIAREARPLPDRIDADVSIWQHRQRELLWHRWGLDHRRPERVEAPQWHITATVDQDTHTIECGWFEPSPGLVVTANLYRPAGEISTGAGMLYLCGHSPGQKVNYQDHPRRLAQLGFTTLILDTLQYGEVPGLHHGQHGHGAFHWISRGYSPAAAEGWIAVRGYDLLCSLDAVDGDRIGVTGNSGGGAVSWWAAALEPRLRAVVTSTGTVGEASHLVHRTLDNHCDCYFPVNPNADAIASIYALVAPRPTLVLAPRFDLWCEYESVVATVEQLGDWYAARTGGGVWPLEVFGFDAEHTYTPASRRRAFGWLTEHLRDTGTAAGELLDEPTQPADIDGVRLPAERLRVFVDQPAPPADNGTVQDWLLEARDPAPQDPVELASQIIDTCFAFASFDIDTGARITRRYWRGDTELFNLEYEPEPGWALEAMLRRPREVDWSEAQPTRVTLLDRESPRVLQSTVSEPELTLAVRGTGRTAWHPRRDWHIRRAAALLGRPLGAMRVLDVVRGLEAHRVLFGEATFTLVARRELAFPALLAALLDPTVARLQLADLPETLDLADPEAERLDGDGHPYVPQTEISLILRIADVDDILRAVRTRAVVDLE